MAATICFVLVLASVFVPKIVNNDLKIGVDTSNKLNLDWLKFLRSRFNRLEIIQDLLGGSLFLGHPVGGL